MKLTFNVKDFVLGTVYHLNTQEMSLARELGVPLEDWSFLKKKYAGDRARVVCGTSVPVLQAREAPVKDFMWEMRDEERALEPSDSFSGYWVNKPKEEKQNG